MAMEDYGTYKAGILLWKIVPPFLLLFGMTGNVLTFLTLTRKQLRHEAMSVFLAALSVSDFIALLTGLLRQWIKYTFDVDIRVDLTVSGCRFHWFIVYVSTQFSSWMLICVTIERGISTWMPHKRHLRYDVKGAGIAVAVTLGALICLDGHYLFGYSNVERLNENTTYIEKCVPSTKAYDNFVIYTWTWIDLCVFYLIPMIVLLIGNSLIIFKVLQSYRRSHAAIVPVTGTNTNGNRMSSLTKSLLLVSILFIVCITPVVVYPIGQPYWQPGASDSKLAMMFFFEALANLFMYVNHSVNFVLYFLSGSRFRNEVKKLLCYRRVAPGTEITTVSRSGI
ncbi:hypothetical protein ACF0H5_007771 [Mactra antiquata]